MRAPLLLLCLALLVSCDDMTQQAKENAYSSQRTAPGQMPAGMVKFQDKPVAPPPVTLAVIARGQTRFHIFCTPCHSELGDGRGMVVQRGFPAPPSYELERLREAPPQHFYDVITNGHGAMYSFAQRIPATDRWAIVAYIHALQLSQHATLADLTPAEKAALP